MIHELEKKIQFFQYIYKTYFKTLNYKNIKIISITIKFKFEMVIVSLSKKERKNKILGRLKTFTLLNNYHKYSKKY